MMHERLAMAMFARLGQAAPRESYCRLFINNEYQGLYAIVESVDNSFLARTLGEDTGYLFSYQHRGPFYGEYLGDELDPYKLLFEPQNHEREADSALYDPIRVLFREVNQPEDAVWRDRVDQTIDLAQFVTQAAIESFLAEEDGLIGVNGMNNFYLYRLSGTNRHRFIPWDKDSSFLLLGFPILTRMEQNVVLQKAMGYADLRGCISKCSVASVQPLGRTGSKADCYGGRSSLGRRSARTNRFRRRRSSSRWKF